MAIAYTVTNVHSEGNLRSVHGTFTSALGDSGGTLGATTHGLNYIVDHKITLDPGGVDTPIPRGVVSSGTITWSVSDTLGYSGRFYVIGR